MQWKGPFKVVATVGVNDYRINMGGKVKTFHANLLKKYIARDQDIHQAAVDEGPPTTSSAISAASLTVIDDIEGEHFNDSDCETLPELGGWGSNDTVNDLQYGDQLTPDQRRQLEEIASSYSSIFSDRPGTVLIEEHRIELTSSTPVRQRPYPVPYAMRQTLRDELRKMEDLKIIRKSSSPYSSPVVVVKKKDGSNRVCIDYRRRLREANFTVRPIKSVLGSSTIDFLGHRLGQGTISLQDENVEKVRNAPRPKTKKEVRAFLGLVGFYKEFVPNFAAISAPLSDLVRKGQPNTVNWTVCQEKAFNSLKFAVTSKPVLQLPDINNRFILRTDASGGGLGAALMQEVDDLDTSFQVQFLGPSITRASSAVNNLLASSPNVQLLAEMALTELNHCKAAALVLSRVRLNHDDFVASERNDGYHTVKLITSICPQLVSLIVLIRGKALT
ncbi:Pol polyprotein [Elysia marginata]|uniref:Pol polyprotein n=1 Tax=Elysia marginata TaxID=1093978 RepID=A0AAV4H4B5_9GAST|nr:Pol polyprotein [Elysia marginata]